MITMEPKRCYRCNRPLKNQKSRERGYGYVCYRKVKRDEAWKAFERIQITIYEFLQEGEKGT